MERNGLWTASDLTVAVKKINEIPVHYKGVSDHRPHAQRVRISDIEVVIATFNTLKPSLMHWHTGKWPMHLERPADYCLADQGGLENCVFVKSENKQRRIDTTVAGICALFSEHKSVVLCLQEYNKELHDLLSSFSEEYNFKIILPDPGVYKWRLATLVSDNLNVIAKPLSQFALKISFSQIDIINVHMRYTTAETMKILTDAVFKFSNRYQIVVGDFNVQTRDLGDKLVRERICTATLMQMSGLLVSARYPKPYFARRIDGWTNFNMRMNTRKGGKDMPFCDHFDNIMFVTRTPKIIFAEPLEWDITME